MATLVLAPAAVRADEVTELYDSIFAPRVKQAARTATRADDLALAEEMIQVARDASTPKALTILLCDQVFTLASKAKAGVGLAAEAMDLLARTDPTRQREALDKTVILRNRQFLGSRGEQRKTTGAKLIDVHQKLATLTLASDDVDAGLGHLRRALQVANVVGSPARQRLQETIQRTIAQQKLTSRIAALKEQIKGKDPAAAQQLLAIYVVELDQPEQARKYTFLATDEKWKTHVSLAAKDPILLTTPEALVLGDWYRSLALSAPPAAQAAMYVRAHRYYQFFLTTTKDGGTDRLRATVGLSTVDAALRRLDRDPTSIRPLAQGTALTPAAPSPAPGAVAMELLSIIDPVMDTLEGQWAIQGGRLRVAVDQARNVLAVPVSPQGSYRLQIRFARVRGSSDVNVYLPIGSRGVELIMSSHDGAYSGLNGLKGIAHHKEGNPTTRSGKLINSHVYELDIEVGHRAHQCSIDVQLDGQPYLTWNGPISDLPNTDPTIRLRTHHARALYHSIKLTMRDGVAKHARTGKVLDQARPDRDRGIELLAVIDLSKDRVHGQISLDDGVIRISPDGARPARLEIPVVPEGSYHLRLRFRRTHGDESMNAHLPVGRGRVLLVLGGYPPYSMSGLESIGGKRVNANETATKAFKITTGKLHQAKITVRRGERQSTIEVDVDGQRVISWTGSESQLSVWQGWDLPHRGTLGLGTPRPGREVRQVMDVLSANLKMISGRARFLRTPQDSPGPDANAPELLRPAINAKLGNKGSTWHFDWSPVAGATEYEIHVMGARAGRPVLHTKVPKPPHDFLLRGGISGANLPGWTWKVRAISDGRPGPWSTPRTFDVVPPTRR